MSELSAEAQARIREIAERRLTTEELRTALATPLGAEERERTLELFRWFTRRYPTGAERLAYVRRAYGRWTARYRQGP